MMAEQIKYKPNGIEWFPEVIARTVGGDLA